MMSLFSVGAGTCELNSPVLDALICWPSYTLILPHHSFIIPQFKSGKTSATYLCF